MRGSVCGVVALVVSFLMVSGPAAATGYTAWVDGQNLGSPFMRVYGPSLPPMGYVSFCSRFRDQCEQSPSAMDRMDLTPDRLEQLQAVNTRVNAMIRPVTDQELYGRVEYWTFPQSQGDCEDYVLLKRHWLSSLGWPLSALLITVVKDEVDEGHAILTVRTSKGDFVLDNKTDAVLAWHKTPYRFVKRQSYRDPNAWVWLLPSDAHTSVAASSANDR